MAVPRKILVIEDDRDIAHLVQMHLRDDLGYEVDAAYDGDRGLEKALATSYDLIVLDLTLPGRDGLDICRQVRAQSGGGDALVLMLTARSSEVDRVLGLEMGADDYLVKPFSIRELLARVRALFRRAERTAADDERLIRTGDLLIEHAKRRVTVAGTPVSLTAKEFDLLAQFACHPGRVYTRSDLLDIVWGDGYEGYEHTVSSHINRLRAKIETDPARPHYLLTVWGVGYKFADNLNEVLPSSPPHADVPADGAALRAALRAAPGGRLPAALTRFFGRELEIAHVETLLGSPGTRLVTLTGLGGAGKTRLALEVAGRLRETFDDAVYFASLSDLTDAHRIAEVIRDALGVSRSASAAPPLAQVMETLRERPNLLVLDNFEHLVEDGAPFVRALLAGVPTLTCLVTSRQRLGLAGEQEFSVLPLPTPDASNDAGAAPERLAACFASVALFADRARAARPDFTVTTDNSADVAALCRRLEGIPLAIELAAVRSKALSPAQMLSQMERRFDFLVSRKRDAAPRHRSLRAALDWSCALLPADLARFFARLSVFRGGWTHAAAQVVGAVPSALALEYLEHLQDDSLVLAEERDGAMCFRMLETVRERAAELLDDAERAALERGHAAHFLRLAEEAEPQLLGAEQALWLNRLEAEHDNLRAALEFCRTNGDGLAAETGLRLAGALWRFWQVRGYLNEGRERLAAVLSQTLPPGTKNEAATGPLLEARAKALNGAGNLADQEGDYAAARLFYEECLVLQRGLGDRAGVAVALNNLGQVAHAEGDFARARSFFDESLALWWELGGRWGIAYLLDNKGRAARRQGDDATALSLFEVSLAIRRELDDKGGIGESLINLALEAADVGDAARARSLLDEGVAVGQELGDRRGVARCLEASRRCGERSRSGWRGCWERRRPCAKPSTAPCRFRNGHVVMAPSRTRGPPSASKASTARGPRDEQCP